MYGVARAALLMLDPETAHNVALRTLKLTDPMRRKKTFGATRKCMGIEFPNPVGLAAGFDKDGDYVDCLSNLGFGFIEVGTVTPELQVGNSRPRLFRLREEEAIVNGMGFNNKGVVYLHDSFRRKRPKGIVGVSVGCNAVTPKEYRVDDYILCMYYVYTVADYVAINISSPNTEGLRDLEFFENTDRFLAEIWDARRRLEDFFDLYVPFVVKVSPDMSEDRIKRMADCLVTHHMEGVIATNTTKDFAGNLAGGLSGPPLFHNSLRTVSILNDHLQGVISIIACGGISSGIDASIMVDHGASLVQILTGFVYQGPKLIQEIAEELQGSSWKSKQR